jgi:hypothetical protein
MKVMQIHPPPADHCLDSDKEPAVHKGLSTTIKHLEKEGGIKRGTQFPQNPLAETVLDGEIFGLSIDSMGITE